MFPHLSKKEVAVEGYVFQFQRRTIKWKILAGKVPAVTWRGFCWGTKMPSCKQPLCGDAAKKWSGKIVQWLGATEDGEFPRTLFIAITLRVQTKEIVYTWSCNAGWWRKKQPKLVAARYLQPKLGSRDFIFSPCLRAMPPDIRLETPTPNVIHIFLTLQVSKIFIFSIWMHFSGVYPCCRNERPSRPWKTVVMK